MKLFSLPDGSINRLDRAQWLTCPFDLAFAAGATPAGIPTYRPTYGPPMLGAPWMAQRRPEHELAHLHTAPTPRPPHAFYAPEITTGPPMLGAPWLSRLPLEFHRGSGGAGLVLPGSSRPSPNRPLVSRVPRLPPGTDRRLVRFTEHVATLLDSLLVAGYIRMTASEPLTFAVVGGGLSGAGPPTSDTDAAAGAVPGCSYVDTAAGRIYFCVSAAIGLAVWRGPF